MDLKEVHPDSSLNENLTIKTEVEDLTKCEDNVLESVDCDDNVLDSVICEENVLECIKCEDNVLESIKCEDNVLESIKCEDIVLESIPCEDNVLKSIKCEDNVLESIKCEDNVLESIKCEDNVLGSIKCEDNVLESVKSEENVVDSIINQIKEETVEDDATQAELLTEDDVQDIESRDGVYESKWFGYNAFPFVLQKSKCRKTLTTAEIHLDKETVKDNDGNDEVAIQEIANTRETKAKHPKHVPSKTKKLKLEATTDPRIDKAFNLLEECAQRDGCDVYGEHIAVKLRSYSKRTQAVVQHLFSNILFNADMGLFDNHIVHANSTNASSYNYVQSPLTTISPYSSPHSSFASNNNDWLRTSTPFSQPQSAYPHVSTEQIINL